MYCVLMHDAMYSLLMDITFKRDGNVCEKEVEQHTHIPT